MRRLLACLLVFLATGHSGAQPPPSTEPQQTFRIGVDVVRLDVSVLDRNRQPVRGLRAEDFTVLEDGKPQPVVAFAAVEIPSPPPVAADWMRQVGSDVATNQLDLRRIVVIIMDDGMSSFDEGVPKTARDIASAVIDRLGPNDLAAVVFTLSGNAQNFTSNPRQLIAAVDSFSPKSGLVPRQGTAAAGNSPAMAGGPPLACAMPGGGPNCLTRTLTSVATALEDTAVGRKTIVLISSGAPYKFTLESLDAASDIHDLQKTFRSLQRANVNVYPLDPRGLTNEGIISDRIDSLRMFAEHTGGRATVATNTPWEQVPQVFAENSSYYLLGIRPAPGQSSGFRRISIKVARPGAEVRTRAGYFAPGSTGRAVARQPATGLEKAFAAALPSGTLPLDMSAASFAAADPRQGGVVIVTTGVRRPSSASLAVEKLDLRAAAFEVSSVKERASQRTTAELTLRPGANGERRFEVHSRLAVKPGRYEIRAAAEVPGSAGGVFTQVEVPNFAKARLSLSGLVLGLRGSALPPELAGVLPIVPTAARVFAPSAQVHAFLRVYQGGKGSLVPVQMRLRIVDASTRSVVDETTTLDAARFGSGRSTDWRFEVPLSRLGGGDYLFSIEVRAGKIVESREIRFGVRQE